MSLDTNAVLAIESKWQRRWLEKDLFKSPEVPRAGKKFYCLEMFPYPSGSPHMGHLRNYAIGDVLARYKRMNGFDVLHPIGWDAFGLPAENAAIKNGVEPETWTRENIAAMKKAFESWGLSYDWSREIATCDPEYYRWNQWFFLQLLNRGLAYRKKAPVNFCPGCQTVLANEQVSAEKKCWRCDSEVVLKDLEQWFFKITAYSDELLQDHAHLASGWPEQVLSMQRNWIGKSEGTEIQFELADHSASIAVFTTRPDTLWGVTSLVLAPEHPLAPTLATAETRVEVDRYLHKIRRRTPAPRKAEPARSAPEGVFTGAYAVHPLNAGRIPVWISDYVLTEYGTGAIMSVPAHDQRDFNFARTHRLPVLQVIAPAGSSPSPLEAAYEGPGVLVNSGPFSGLDSEAAKHEIAEQLEKDGKAKRVVRYRLKDWLISRQRAWGTPIPILYCGPCGMLPVPEKDLPVRLPKKAPYTGKGASPLAQVEEFLNASCPKCGGPARRETDTMDTFVDSSWYYARYLDPRNADAPFSLQKAKNWLPVDQYIGGIEHACMHLIYARFLHKAMRDMNLLMGPEPFSRLLSQGMVTLEGSAMSKSKGNAVSPDEIVQKYGADTVRLFMLFAAPPEQSLEWSDEGVEGAWRFLNRALRLLEGTPSPNAPVSNPDASNLLHRLNQAIQNVTEALDRFRFNTAISELHKLANALHEYPSQGDANSRKVISSLAVLLAPFAPHLAEEIWERLGHSESIFKEPWPEADPQYLVEEEIQMAVQVDGKVRTHLKAPSSWSEQEIREKALDLERVRRWTTGHTIKKVVVVPRKLVNIVTTNSQKQAKGSVRNK